RGRFRGKFCAVEWSRRSECEQSFNRSDAAASPDWHQRHRPGFAFASSQSQARAGTIARHDRERSSRTAHGRNREARERAAQKIAEASCAEEENSGIETQASGTKEAANENQARLGARVRAERSPRRPGRRILRRRTFGRICFPNTSADATCDELVCKQTIYLMKKAMLLSGAVAVLALPLISCGSSPETSTPTTRQTTVTTAPPPAASQRTTTTTTHMGGGY